MRRGIGKERQEEEEGEGGDEEGGGVFGEDNGDLVDGMIGGRKKSGDFGNQGFGDDYSRGKGGERKWWDYSICK